VGEDEIRIRQIYPHPSASPLAKARAQDRL
jgi:hypothetical protein